MPGCCNKGNGSEINRKKYKPLPDQILTILKDQTKIISKESGYNDKTLEGARISRLCENNQLLTSYFDGVNTVYDCFHRGLAVSGDKQFLGWKPSPDEPYKWMTYNEVAKRAKNFGDGLVKLGIKQGNETRIGIYSQNRPEYIITDQGFVHHSMCPVPLYDTLGVEACDYIVNHADLECIVCDTNAKVKGLLGRREAMPNVKMLIVYETANDENVKKCQEFGVQIYHIDEVEKIGRDNPIESMPPKPDDLALVCFTSGTTGTPKGAMLSHKNMAVVVAATFKVFDSCGINMTEDDVLISYLPLAHSYERAIEGCIMACGGSIGFFQGDVRKLMDDIKELQPTLFPSVPRLLNRLYDKVTSGVAGSSKLKQFIFNMAIKSKKKDLKKGIVRNTSLWDKLAFKNVQAALGGRVRLITTGSAPISSTVLNFLRCIVGCPLIEGYGQTENTGVATVTIVGDTEPGHVGPPLPSLMVKLVDVPEMDYYSSQNKGEVCLKGGNVFLGYLKDEAKTAEALDRDGWLHTGDVGQWMPSGVLKIIDRKKNIFKLAQGEYIAPEKIENVLVQSPYLAQVYVHGDSLQASIVGVVVPDEATLPGLAAKLGLAGSFEELCDNPDLKKAIQSDLLILAKKNALSSLEQVKDIHIHKELFSVENGLLTPTFKLKRNEARKLFAPQIEEMYQRMNSVPSASQSKTSMATKTTIR